MRNRSRVYRRQRCVSLLGALPAGFWMVDWGGMKDAEDDDDER